MEKLQTKLIMDIDGTMVEYGRIPQTISEKWRGLCFYFATRDCLEINNHMDIVQKAINKLESDSFDHWSEWRMEDAVTMQCDEYYQETLVKFRVRDSY